MRPDRRRRLVVRSAILLVLGGGGLALALGLGLPDPGAAKRAFACLVGVVGIGVAWSWLRAAGGSPAPDHSDGTATLEEHSALAPSVESALVLERAIGFGTTTLGSYHQLVRPRLRALAAAKLARAGCALENEESARRFLGDDWPLVGPKHPSVDDPLAPGVPLGDVSRLVEILEGLP